MKVILFQKLEGIVRPRKKLPLPKDNKKMADMPRLEPIDWIVFKKISTR